MEFRFSRYGLNAKEQMLERFFEILPGFVSWSIIFGMIYLSWAYPLPAVIIIIIFDFYWLLRLFYITIFLVLCYFRLALDEKVQWEERIAFLNQWHEKSQKPDLSVLSIKSFSDFLSRSIFENDLKKLEKIEDLPPLSQDLHHLVIIPIASEPRRIVEPGILSILKSCKNIPNIVIFLAVEERAPQGIKDDAQALVAQYREAFKELRVVLHPSGIPGEARVKGANATYAAKEALLYFRENEIPYEHVIVSCFDADTVVSPHYFASLTYSYMVCPGRERASFQPIPVYHNNIWEVPNFARILEIGASFFQMTEATNPEKLVTFSSHSMSFKALVDIDYWPVDMISDDSAIFWKAFLHYHADYRVIPMYVTVSMDIVGAESTWETMTNVYRQKRRWAWGVENFPIVMRGFLRSNKISWWKKITMGLKLFEAHVAWTYWPFMLAIAGWLPIAFAHGAFEESVLYYNMPRITGTVFNLATLSLFITVILSLILLPKEKNKRNIGRRILHAFEWLLIPLIAIFFTAIPALDAQTRLMSGKYMEFWVSTKKREVT